MTRPPALHVWKFLMKNMIPTNSGLTMVLIANLLINIFDAQISHFSFSHYIASKNIKFIFNTAITSYRHGQSATSESLVSS